MGHFANWAKKAGYGLAGFGAMWAANAALSVHASPVIQALESAALTGLAATLTRVAAQATKKP